MKRSRLWIVLASILVLALTSSLPLMAQDTGKVTDQTYTVKRGDNLTKIAEQFSVTVNCLVQSNRIANPNLIYVGQELTVTASCQGGGGGGTTSTSSVAQSDKTCAFDRNPGREASDGTYTVIAGDSLDFIACDFGISLACLTQANPQVANEGRIKIGEELNIDLSCPGWTAWPGAGELPSS